MRRGRRVVVLIVAIEMRVSEKKLEARSYGSFSLG
jgi:hypothetical protein